MLAMPPRPRFRKAETREQMRAFNVWIAEDLHRALMLRRVERGMSVNEMVREALAEWLRGQPRRRKGVR